MVRRNSFATVLGAYGIPIATARDGLEGLATFRRISPTVVLTDIIMPGKEGLETIMAMRRERPATKIIAMSGSGGMGKRDYLTIAKNLGRSCIRLDGAARRAARAHGLRAAQRLFEAVWRP